MNTHFDPELSRLAVEDRLIEFCEDRTIPVLERVRLLAIFAERVDVFFMTRVGRLKRLAVTGEQKRAAPTLPAEQLRLVSTEAKRMMQRAYALCDMLLEELRDAGVRLESFATLDERDRAFVRHSCAGPLSRLATPVRVNGQEGLPHVRNLRPAILADARECGSGAPVLVVVELPAELPRLVPLGEGNRFVPLEQVVAAGLPALCRDLEIVDARLFRVTRNGHTELDDDEDELREFEQEIVRRPFQEVVRLEVEQGMPLPLREWLLAEFDREAAVPVPFLGAEDLYTVDGLVDLTALEEIASLDLPRLKRPDLVRRPTRVDHVFDRSDDAGDALLRFPFDDYETSLERFLQKAAAHPELESIQTTIYRTDRDSDVVAALGAARARGRGATAVVEVKASFDERENIERARALEAAGVQVVLSPASLKVHAKVALVTFREGHEPRRVALIGTGNMNAITARAYIDLWLVTRDPARTSDVASVFDTLTGGMEQGGPRCEHLFVSPFDMRQRFLELIEQEIENATAGRPSGIRAMMNGLSDRTVITALYRASQAGVPVDLMVRGLCLLRPREPGISDHIRVVSVAGHLLQHARIYHFRNAGHDRWFIGSADWRPRNFDVRVEVITTVTQPDHIGALDRMLTETLATPDAWELQADGTYARRA